MRHAAALAGTILLCGGLAGCAADVSASSGGCTTYTAFNAGPASATADHAAAAPDNQQKFTATEAPAGTGTGCILPTYIKVAQPNWTSSDPLNVSISSAKDLTNGTATCTGTTSGPVTLTATSTDDTKPKTVSVQLSCK